MRLPPSRSFERASVSGLRLSHAGGSPENFSGSLFLPLSEVFFVFSECHLDRNGDIWNIPSHLSEFR